VVVACLVANYFTHSINEHKLHRIGVPLIEDEMEHDMYDLFAADVMRRRVLTVRRYARVDKMYAYLLNSTHHGFPVVEHESQVMNRLRSTSVATLERAGTAAADEAERSPGGSRNAAKFDNDLMMHSLNAGSLRDDDQFHVPTATSVFQAGETLPKSPNKKKTSTSPKKKSTPTLRVAELSVSELAAPDEWHSPAHARRDAAAAMAATTPNLRHKSSARLTRGQSSMDVAVGASAGPNQRKEKERSHFTGMVTRAQLIHALATRTKHANIELAHAAAEVETATEHARRLREELSAAALHDKELRKINLMTLDIQPHHHKMLIDLGPYIDDGVLSVTPNTPLGRVHRLFVSCGLRHLVVTDTDNEVSGIITRKDLTMQTNTVAFPQERPLVPAAVTRALSRLTSKDSNSSTQSSVGRLQNSLRSIAEDKSSSSSGSTPKLSAIAFSESTTAASV
jgi:CBS domain-containing protein